jgi:serpin B
MTLPRWLATMLVSAVCLAGAATSTTHAGTADQDVATIAAENNDFAVDLYGQLAATPGNLFFSPYSIDSALAMTLNGARTETAAQMRTVLHSSLSPRRMNAAFSALSSELDNIPQVNGTAAYDLAVANALYGQSSFTFNPGFLQTLQQDYGAPLNLVDFKQNADQAAQTIDDWVAQQTNNKIQDLFAPGSIPDNTRLVLVNAIYFLGNWDNKFDPNQTENQPFHLGNGQPDVTVPIMRQTEVLSYMENDQAQVLDIPYVAEKLSMVILLPRSVDGLSALESKLTAGKLSRWMDQLSGYQVSVFLPN